MTAYWDGEISDVGVVGKFKYNTCHTSLMLNQHPNVNQEQINEEVNSEDGDDFKDVIEENIVKWNAKLNEHIVKGKNEKDRRKSLDKVGQLLAEMLETERNYVADLEDICREYLPLVKKQGDLGVRRTVSLDRKKRRKSQEYFRRSFNETFQNMDVGKAKPILFRRRSESVEVSERREGEEGISVHDARVMLGNIEELKDYHKKVVLAKMERAKDDASLLRDLFTAEVTKMKIKYGRYCINKARSNQVVSNNIKFLEDLAFHGGFNHGIDAMLIKPVQRLTRYHMFLSSLAEASTLLGSTSCALDYRVAQAAVLEAANHTNTLMWIGQLHNSPLDLSRQGNLLKHGPVKVRGERCVWKSSPIQDSHLFLFQQTLLLCKVVEDKMGKAGLVYKFHINVNNVIVDFVEGGDTLLVRRIAKEKLNKIILDAGGGDAGGGRKEKAAVKVMCESVDEAEEWAAAIRKEIRQLGNFALLLTEPRREENFGLLLTEPRREENFGLLLTEPRREENFGLLLTEPRHAEQRRRDRSNIQTEGGDHERNGPQMEENKTQIEQVKYPSCQDEVWL